MSRTMITEIARVTMRNHPPECVFAENALEKIVDEVMDRGVLKSDELIEVFAMAIRRQEIYCPHEGIGV